jgi:chemotaxis protein MotB
VYTRKKNEFSVNVWPCFVDALSSLLIVIVFAIIGSFVLQVYLSTALNDTDTSLKSLQRNYASLQKQYVVADAECKKLQIQLQRLQEIFTATKTSETKLKVQNFNLNTQVADLAAKIADLNALLELVTKEAKQKENVIKENMNRTVEEKIEQLKNLQEQLMKLQDEIVVLKAQIPQSILKNPELLKYRSEFFATLQNVLGGRSDIRTVGDRFVFQAEVLFARGSDELGEQGKAALDTLAQVLKDISGKMPASVNWVLRVDGHTDKLPIHNDRFESNWELSTSRALCVVKYLVSKGISPKNLAAAGFAEYYPLTSDVNKMDKNRRIEFRFDSI